MVHRIAGPFANCLALPLTYCRHNVQHETASIGTRVPIPMSVCTLCASAAHLMLYNLPTEYRHDPDNPISSTSGVPVGRFFQIRENDRPSDHRLYATLGEASGVLVRNHIPRQVSSSNLTLPSESSCRDSRSHTVRRLSLQVGNHLNFLYAVSVA